MRWIVFRATASKFTRALVVISPASTTRLFLTSVSAATRERGSCARIASSTASEIWSATLSGCPSDTDSEVNRKSLIAWRLPRGGGKDTKNLSFPSVILRLAGKLPLPLLHALGSVLGWAMYGISPTYRRKLRANLQQAGYSEARIRRQAIAGAGQMIAELPAIWFRPQAEVASLVREATGFDEVFAAQEEGTPILLLTPHLGCFEVTAQYIALHM